MPYLYGRYSTRFAYCPGNNIAMKPDKFLFKNSHFLFIAFFIGTLWAFWPSYFSRLLANMDIHFHLHGIVMTLWCLLLILQAFLIRAKRRAIHRFTGKVSYVLVPLIIITTINLVHYQMREISNLTSMDLCFLSLVLNALVVFVVIYLLAMINQDKPAIHARYMVGTIFPLFTPVTDRLISAHFRMLVPLVPTIDGKPFLPPAGFLLADMILAGLMVWDWRAGKRNYAFLICLILLVLYHTSVLTFYKFPFWQAFSNWFLSLPLS